MTSTLRLIDAQRMRAAASYPSLVDALHAAHREREPASGDLLLHDPVPGSARNLLARAAWQAGGALGVKVATVFPDNAARAPPVVQGVYLLFDGGDGRALAALDGTELTYWKTAADSALGARLLARENARELLMVGAGALAPHLIRAHCALRPSIRRVTVWNRTPRRARALARSAPVSGVAFEACDDLEPAARRADLICCATMSGQPLIRGAWLRAGQHVDLVGGYLPTMREADDEAAARARVFVDARASTLDRVGDICQPIASGALAESAIEGDLYDLCRSGPRPPRADSDITLFKNGGGGHLDLFTACYFAARARARA